MPQMIHMLNEGKTSGHIRKHSNSFQGKETHDEQDSFDDSTEDLTEASHKVNFDAMPPPPPPPLEWNGDTELNILAL